MRSARGCCDGDLLEFAGLIAVEVLEFESERSFSTALEFALSSLSIGAASAIISRLILGLYEATVSPSRRGSDNIANVLPPRRP